MKHLQIACFIACFMTSTCMMGQKRKGMPESTSPIISRIHWITINTRTLEMFDSLRHLLTEELQMKDYKIIDYENNIELGIVNGNHPGLNLSFEIHQLIGCIPDK